MNKQLRIATLVMLAPVMLSCAEPSVEDNVNAPKTVSATVPIETSARNDSRHKVIGKITAKMDGNAMTWHVISPDEVRYRSAAWVPLADKNLATLGGYESLDVTFEGDKVSGPGSMIVLSIPFADGDADAHFELPRDDSASATLIYMERVGDYSSMRSVKSGVIEATRIDVSSISNGSFIGTFSGSSLPMDDGSVMAITDGKFEIGGVQKVEPATR